MNNLNLPTLQSRKSSLKVTMMYKIVHNLVPIPKASTSPQAPLVHITITSLIKYPILELTAIFLASSPRLPSDYGTAWTVKQ